MEFTPEVLHAAEASRRQEDLVLGALAVDLEQLAGIDEERPEDVVERKRGTPESGMFVSIRIREVCRGPSGVSLQMHHHRAEHWVVVSGTARVTRGDETFLLAENQSTYIPIGTRHRLGNPGEAPLEVIEVQSGTYLGEDDIVRFEDTYGRS